MAQGPYAPLGGGLVSGDVLTSHRSRKAWFGRVGCTVPAVLGKSRRSVAACLLFSRARKLRQAWEITLYLCFEDSGLAMHDFRAINTGCLNAMGFSYQALPAIALFWLGVCLRG